MYGPPATAQPTFGAYPGAGGGYGQPPSFGQAPAGNWPGQAGYNEEKLGHKAVKDPLLSAIK